MQVTCVRRVDDCPQHKPLANSKVLYLFSLHLNKESRDVGWFDGYISHAYYRTYGVMWRPWMYLSYATTSLQERSCVMGQRYDSDAPACSYMFDEITQYMRDNWWTVIQKFPSA